MAAFLASGKYESHVNHVTGIYKAKRNLMIKTLNQAFDDISFACPDGGFNIWVTFKEDISMRDLFEEGLRKGVVITPGYHFMVDGRDRLPQMRLNFTYPSDQEIVKGIDLLAECYEKIRNKGKDV
jgi:2-aminoadipate transaminase